LDRFELLVPALVLLGTFGIAFAVYCARCIAGRPPIVRGVKHNQVFGPFFARFLVWLLGPLERLLLGRVSPNAITMLSLVLCALTGLAAGLGHLSGSAWLFAFAGIADVLDGRLARLGGKQTAAGALFDSVSDRWGELFAFAGYAWYLHDSTWLLAVLAAIAGSMMVSYTRARAEGLGVALGGGIMQRAERIVLVSGGALLASWYGSDDFDAIPPILGGTMVACALAATATAVHRWIVAYRVLARRVSTPPISASALSEPDPSAPAPDAAAPRPVAALVKLSAR
jgi:CDP-diacylglycerol--glycerol-3-phosphate 3-phosphatidyltransferase